MYVFFDWEVDDNLKQPSNPKALMIYEDLKNFYLSRYKVLEADFEREFNITGKPVAIMLSIQDTGVEIQVKNASDDLYTKIQQSLTEDDNTYILDIIEQKLKTLDDAELN